MMQIQLVDINTAPAAKKEDGSTLRAGVILLQGENEWVASNGLQSWSSSAGLSALASGHIWLSDAPFRRSREWMKSRNDMIVVGANWLRYTFSDMAAEWGISDSPKPDIARHLATLIQQVMAILDDAIGRIEGADGNSAGNLQNVCSQASLATGMRLLMGDRVRLTPRGLKPLDIAIDNLFQANIVLGKRTVSAFQLHLPRLSHARKILAARLPAPNWKAANIPEGTSTADILEWARSVDGPVILNVNLPQTTMVKPIMRPWFEHFGGKQRTWFTLTEIETLLESSPELVSVMHVAGIFASPGWDGRSVFSRIVDSVLDSCGGKMAAPYSWPLGIFANNCLLAATRIVKETDENSIFIDGAWLAAIDRIETGRAAGVLMDAGIKVLNYHRGRIDIYVGDDPESVMTAVDAAWRAGLVIPHGLAAMAARYKIRAVGKISDWGGDPADMQPAALHAVGARDVIWRMASIRDLDPGLRSAAFEQEYATAFGQAVARAV